MAVADANELSHDIYHLGPGENYDVRAVAEAVRAVVSEASIELGAGTEPWTTFTAMRGPLAGTRLHDDTGFQPAHSLAQGIAAYADWMRANRALWA